MDKTQAKIEKYKQDLIRIMGKIESEEGDYEDMWELLKKELEK